MHDIGIGDFNFDGLMDVITGPGRDLSDPDRCRNVDCNPPGDEYIYNFYFQQNDGTFALQEAYTVIDYPQDNEIEVVYHIGSYSDSSLARQILVLATRAQRETNPIPGNDATKLPTLRDVFYSVEFHEREVFEMLGVFFEGHPDNRRLLLPEDWADLPPLRKDFAIKGR